MDLDGGTLRCRRRHSERDFLFVGRECAAHVFRIGMRKKASVYFDIPAAV